MYCMGRRYAKTTLNMCLIAASNTTTYDVYTKERGRKITGQRTITKKLTTLLSSYKHSWKLNRMACLSTCNMFRSHNSSHSAATAPTQPALRAQAAAGHIWMITQALRPQTAWTTNLKHFYFLNSEASFPVSLTAPCTFNAPRRTRPLHHLQRRWEDWRLEMRKISLASIFSPHIHYPVMMHSACSGSSN